MPFRLCSAPATFQRLMQSSLGEVNLTYHLIYLGDVIVFSKIKEEHVQSLHVLFDHFWEHNLKLIPTKCKFFWDEIDYLAHHDPQRGDEAQQKELESCGRDCSALNLYGNLSLSGLGGALLAIHQRVCCIAQPLHKHLSGEGASKTSEWVMLMAEAKNAFEMLKKACLEAPVLTFANCNKPFLLQTNTS